LLLLRWFSLFICHRFILHPDVPVLLFLVKPSCWCCLFLSSIFHTTVFSVFSFLFKNFGPDQP
jgi:hypothetical protein